MKNEVEKYYNGDRYWLIRLDGPIFEDSNGNKRWLKNGKYHRIEGPAWEHSNGNMYYLNDKKLTKEEWEKQRHEK